jgi:hypothetical protein
VLAVDLVNMLEALALVKFWLFLEISLLAVIQLLLGLVVLVVDPETLHSLEEEDKRQLHLAKQQKVVVLV